MKSTLFSFGIAAIVILGIVASQNLLAKPKTSTITIKEKGFTIVELFTSEGCSSCPPADQALAQLAHNHPKLIVLSFHVDYWNKLGWKDPYSSAQYTQRQRDYATTTQGDGIYTPQAIVNGIAHFIGSEAQKIEKQLTSLPSKSILLTAKRQERLITISYASEKSDREILHIALLQKHGRSEVTAGENRGANLSHINIVSGFKTTSEKKGLLSFEFPKELNPSDYIVVGYTQEKNSMQITGTSGYIVID